MAMDKEAVALIVAGVLTYAVAPAPVAVAVALTLATAALLGLQKGK